jgi:hypothetical protein
LEEVNVIRIGADPQADDAAKGKEALNLMLKTWGADPKPKLWQVTNGTVTLIASTASYALTSARKVISVRRRTSSVDTPLTPMSRQEYDDFPTKSASGMPYQWYFDPQRASRTLYVVNVPDATIAASTTLPYTYLRVIEDIDALDDDFDVPQEWTEVLKFGLAARLALTYRKHITDPTGYAEIKSRAGELYAQLSAYDDESGSVFFQPNFDGAR